MRVAHELAFFHKQVDGEDMECDVPLRQDARDYPRRVREVLRAAAKFLKERAPVTGFELVGQVVKLETLALAQGGNVTIAGLVDDVVRQVHFAADPGDYQRAIDVHQHERIASVEGELVKDGRSFRLTNPRMFSVAS